MIKTSKTKEKKRLLVMTSTFPRWKNDTVPPFVYELSRRLTDKFEVYILAPSYPGAIKSEKVDGMHIHRFRYFFSFGEKLAYSGGILPKLKQNPLYYLVLPFFFLGEYFGLRNLVKKIKPDVIHAHWIIPQGVVAAVHKELHGTPYVVTSHGSDLMGVKKLHGLKRFVLKNAKNVTVVSQHLKEIAQKIEPSVSPQVIPMGVDTELFNPNKKDPSLRKKYGIKGPFLLFVGRLSYEKGIDILIEAMPEVLKKLPKAKLMIIGDGTLKDKIKQRVKDLSIEQNIIFIGWVAHRELPKYYATADLFISLSEREGSPVSYIEALSSSTPIISSDLKVCKELIGTNRGRTIDRTKKEDISGSIFDYLSKNNFNSHETQLYIKKYYDFTSISTKFCGILR